MGYNPTESAITGRLRAGMVGVDGVFTPYTDSSNCLIVALDWQAAVNAHGLKKEIVSTQRLVDKSVKSINRFACEFGIHHRM
jgi:hypothetical protein